MAVASSRQRMSLSPKHRPALSAPNPRSEARSAAKACHEAKLMALLVDLSVDGVFSVRNSGFYIVNKSGEYSILLNIQYSGW